MTMDNTEVKKPKKTKAKSLSTKKTIRQKVKLKMTPKDAAYDAAKSIKQRHIKSVMVFGQDDWTDEFLKEAMRFKLPMVMFSDFSDGKATHMNKIVARFNGSKPRTQYVNKLVALKEPWADVLIFGATENAERYLRGVGSHPYKETFVLEEF